MSKAKKTYLAIITLCLLTIGFSFYYILGGFDEVQVYFFRGMERTVIGKEFVIKNDHKAFTSQMDSVKEDFMNGVLKGKLTALIYQDEWQEKDSLHCFLGVSQDSTSGVVRLPAGYEYRKFSTDRIYKTFISQSVWVAPSPASIEEMMEVKSIEEGEVLQPITFEIYYRDGSRSIEKWVK
ncbi:MAG: hypothetical protein AAF616_15130 [Bacteroidota bacterium]